MEFPFETSLRDISEEDIEAVGAVVRSGSPSLGPVLCRVEAAMAEYVGTAEAVVVTEYGAVDLKGKSLRERAEALIAIAHPNFRGTSAGFERTELSARKLAFSRRSPSLGHVRPVLALADAPELSGSAAPPPLFT